MDKNIPLRFDASFDLGIGLKATSDPELFYARVRAFYKYSNRNGSYITDEYAKKLAESAYLKPVFGYYSFEEGDFLGHEGKEVKAYGFVIPDSLTWEDHLDEDGVIRTYATYEVLLWANYWEEAKNIINKAQSMEIDPKTVKGSWQFIGDSPFEEYVYTDGVMAGLCILGNSKTPCFEGAAFFDMTDNSYVNFIRAIKRYFEDGGKNTMLIKAPGVEHEMFTVLFEALNPNFNEEGAYSINLFPCEIGEDYVFAITCDKDMKVFKYSYNVDEEKNLNLEQVEEIDYKAIAADFENYKITSANELEEAQNKYSELVNTNISLQNDYNSLTATKEALDTSVVELQQQIEALQNSFNQLQENFNAQAEALADKDNQIATYESKIVDYENKEKEAVIEKFSCLPAEILEEINEQKDSLSLVELNTKLALEYTKFSMAKERGVEVHIPQPEPQETELSKILKNYKKK